MLIIFIDSIKINIPKFNRINKSVYRLIIIYKN